MNRRSNYRERVIPCTKQRRQRNFFIKYYPEKVDKWHTKCYDLANWLIWKHKIIMTAKGKTMTFCLII